MKETQAEAWGAVKYLAACKHMQIPRGWESRLVWGSDSQELFISLCGFCETNMFMETYALYFSGRAITIHFKDALLDKLKIRSMEME